MGYIGIYWRTTNEFVYLYVDIYIYIYSYYGYDDAAW